jgi:hypothetical protein
MRTYICARTRTEESVTSRVKSGQPITVEFALQGRSVGNSRFLKCPFIITIHYLFRLYIILSRVRDSMSNNNGFWIGWLGLLTPITINYNNSQPIFSRSLFLDCRGLSPFSFSFYDWTTYIVSRRTQRKHPFPSSGHANHRENTSSSILLFTACCIATEVIRLLPVYALTRECVYQVVPQQRVYKSQYANHKDAEDLRWLTTILLCHLQDYKDLCHGWWQGNSNLQQFRNHY